MRPINVAVVNALKELAVQNKELKQQIEELKNVKKENQILMARIEKLEEMQADIEQLKLLILQQAAN